MSNEELQSLAITKRMNSSGIKHVIERSMEKLGMG